MRKELTRTKQALDEETVRKIIETTAYGVISLNGDDGYLYTVPLSYVYADGVVYSTARREDTSTIVFREQIKPAFRSSDKARLFRVSERIIFKAFLFGDDCSPSPTRLKNSPLFVRLQRSTVPAFLIMKMKSSIL